MRDKLAILIIGEQNSGKTTTLRSYSDYYHKPVSTLKKGFRWDIAPFRPKFEAVKMWAYLLPSSPTESNIPLADTVDPIEWYPDLILMPEQLNGNEYSNSIHYLMANEYEVKEYNISNYIGDGIWDRWKDGDKFRMEAKLLQRREEIADYIRSYLVRKLGAITS